MRDIGLATACSEETDRWIIKTYSQTQKSTCTQMSSGGFSTELLSQYSWKCQSVDFGAVRPTASVFVMRLLIRSSSGVWDEIPGMYGLIPPVLAWNFSKCPSDAFITVTYMEEWFTGCKCSYRGEALGFWTWLCKSYLHNQVLGVIFLGVIYWIK